VPIDKIISSESARGKFESIVKEVAADKKGIYVLTSNGNPVAVPVSVLGDETGRSGEPHRGTGSVRADEPVNAHSSHE